MINNLADVNKYNFHLFELSFFFNLANLANVFQLT